MEDPDWRDVEKVYEVLTTPVLTPRQAGCGGLYQPFAERFEPFHRPAPQGIPAVDSSTDVTVVHIGAILSPDFSPAGRPLKRWLKASTGLYPRELNSLWITVFHSV